jgi:DNA polymerase-3 subunit delta
LQVILSTVPHAAALQTWIANQLKPICSDYERHLPALIHQYTEGNLLAMQQLLKKLSLICEPDAPLTEIMLRTHLVVETNYSLFELADFCLQADASRALQFIRQAAENKSEAPLVLWLLSQEIRTILQVAQAIAQGENLQQVARQLKIWSTKVALYQKAALRIPYSELQRLLALCSQLDIWIKTGQNKPIWQSFEWIILSLCSRKIPNYVG